MLPCKRNNNWIKRNKICKSIYGNNTLVIQRTMDDPAETERHNAFIVMCVLVSLAAFAAVSLFAYDNRRMFAT
jgi:hypothetical protein